jgi:Raf kinase inhibitor-like YbhB/YbcL family protein
MTRAKRSNLAAAGGLIALSCIGLGALAGTPPTQTGFTLTSTTFKDGGMLPQRVGFNDRSFNANCIGDNISPQLSWSRVPPGTKSFAITMVTAEVDDINMVVYGIPTSLGSLPEGALSKPSDSFIGGKNRFGQGTWRGMCTPAGASVHHYILKIIASDLDPAALPPGLTLPELQTRLKGHTTDAAVLVGLFTKP